MALISHLVESLILIVQAQFIKYREWIDYTTLLLWQPIRLRGLITIFVICSVTELDYDLDISIAR